MEQLIDQIERLAVPTIILLILLRFAEMRLWPLVERLAAQMMGELREMATLLARVSERVEILEREVAEHRQRLNAISRSCKEQ